MKEILLVPHLHFDPVWRRCFDRPAGKHGVTVRSYAEIEERCIDTWLGLSGEGYTFSEGQAAVWRKYLERNPGKRDTLRKKAEEGNLDLLLAGEVVPDTNMPAAEGLVRNFLVAQPLYRDLAGSHHPGLKLAWLEDAFGNSANYPQILAGVGAEVVCATTYRVCPDPVWTGIDGTRIPCFDYYPAVRPCSFDKYPPCPECRGSGCIKCDNSGLASLPGYDAREMRGSLEKALALPGDWAAVFILAEELEPDAKLIRYVREFNARHKGKARARFANPSDIYARYLPELRRAAAKLKTKTPTPELNPAMPGCMVSRIRCKQRTRAIAYLLIAAEAGLANNSWRRGKAGRPPASLAKAWQDVCFNQFHDAITGTHIDAAYVELMGMLDRAGRTAIRYLPARRQKRPLSKTRFTSVDAFPAKITLGKFAITFDKSGLLSVLCNGKDVFGTLPAYTAARRPYRIAELVLEADFGDAWGQRIAPFPDLDRDATRVALGDFQSSVETSSGSIRWHGKYRGGDPKVKRLAWTVTLALSPDGRRLDFVTEVDWDTESRRLRVLIPVNSREATATYEIPYGFIDRTFDPAKLDYSQFRSNTMEFPALHWARRETGRRTGVALLNKGLPCVRWMPGRFDLSLLRSPEWSFCAVEAGNYEFWDIDGQRDTGRHRFEYSIWPYYEPLSAHGLTVAGYEYNHALPLGLPFQISGHAIVTAWKRAEDGSGWIIRLQESNGRPSKVTLDFEVPVTIQPANLLEQLQGSPATGRKHRIPLHPHGIKTLPIQFQ